LKIEIETMKEITCVNDDGALVFGIEEMIGRACERVLGNVIEFGLAEEYEYIIGCIKIVRASVKNKETRQFVIENLIGKAGPSYYFIPEVEDSEVDYCYVDYGDSDRWYRVEFYC
jgi:hypothetical protein